MPVENIIIEFTSDTSGLEPAERRLEELGQTDKKSAEIFKATNAELKKREEEYKRLQEANKKLGQQINDTVKSKPANVLINSLSTLSEKSRTAVAELLKLPVKEIEAGFENMGMSAQEFVALLREAENFTGSSLKKQLLGITEEMTRMRSEGQQGTEIYKQLSERAADLRKNITDVGKEVRRLGSDTQTLDTLIGSAQAVAGGFAVAQGATALFGAENEELQETLLRVTSVMSIMQGLQSVQNALQSDGALIRARDVLAIRAQTSAQVLYTTVVGNSTGALKAFRIALAASGIGLIVLAVAALAANWDKVKSAISGVSEEQKKSLKISEETIEKEEEKLELLNDQDNILKLQGKSEKEILKSKIEQIDAILAARGEQIKLNQEVLNAQVEAEKRNKSILAGLTNFISIPINAILNTVSKIASIIGKDFKVPLVGDLVSSAFFNPNEVKEKGDEAREEAEKQLEALKNQRAGYQLQINGIDQAAYTKQQDAAKAARLRILNDQLAALETEKVNAERAGEETFVIEQDIAAKKAKIELENAALTENEKKLIIANSLKTQEDLFSNYLARIKKEEIQALIDRNAAILSQLNISDEERTKLQIENITARYALEISEAKNNAEKIKALEGQRDAEIRELKKAAITQATEDEIALLDSRSGAYRRSLESIAADENNVASERIRAIDSLLNYELAAIAKRVSALDQQLSQGLISEQDHIAAIEALRDNELKIHEDAEKKKTEITETEGQKRVEATKKSITDSVEVAGRAVDILAMVWDNEAQKRNNALQEQRMQIDALLENGAITEKEAAKRRKQLEQAERQEKQRQAERDKKLAVFQALLAIPRAYLQGMAQGGLPLAIIYGGIAAVQAAMVAARPIPKFKKGKKDSYEGPGIVGEAGAELIEQNGKFFIAKKPELVWLNKSDKVYNPAETLAMIPDLNMFYDPKLMTTGQPNTPEVKFDYDRMGKAVGKHIKLPNYGLNINQDGFREWVQKGNLFETYLNNRRGFK